MRHLPRRTSTGAPLLIRRAAVAGASLAATLALAAPAGAATSVQIEDDGTLHVLGDAGNNKIALYNQPSDVAIDLRADGTPEFTVARSAFTAVAVEGRDGDDELTVTNTGGATDLPITLDGGFGSDTLRGTAGGQTLIGGAGDDFADGNTGNDTARLGSGNDRFQWDPGDGSDTVDGETGTDTLDFNGANVGEQIAVTANGARASLTRNIGTVALDLDLERIQLRALGGADTIDVGALQGTAVRSADVDLRSSNGDGDAQPDTVTARGTDAADRFTVGDAAGAVLLDGPGPDVKVVAAESHDHARVAALGEADTIVSDVGVPGPGAVDVDGGDGADRATTRGTDGDDSIGIAPNGGAVATFADGHAVVNHTAVEGLTVQGLAGADRLSALNGIGALTALTLDGGEGDDTLLGGDGADTLFGRDGADLLDGNRGDDTAKLGAGDDRAQWDPGDGSDTIEGGAGNDALDFNASNAGEQVDLSKNGGRVRLFRNIANVTLDFDGLESTRLRALGGADAITIGDLSGTDLTAADVDLSASIGGGDLAQDTVALTGRATADHVTVARSGDQVEVGGLPVLTRIAGSESLNDTLRISTLGGLDDIVVDPAAEQLITPVIDLGADQ
jgi:Ca2+-binding RTX toxin-like protein